MWEERWHLAARGMGQSSLAHRQSRPWSGRGSGRPGSETSGLRSDVLPVSWKLESRGCHQPRHTPRTFVFDNDHPCVARDAPAPHRLIAYRSAIYRNRPATGVARVVCYTPAARPHNWPSSTSTAVMRCSRPGRLPDAAIPGGTHHEVNFVLIFREQGSARPGVSNPHPHLSIYATNFNFQNTTRRNSKAAPRI